MAYPVLRNQGVEYTEDWKSPLELGARKVLGTSEGVISVDKQGKKSDVTGIKDVPEVKRVDSEYR